jgi:hypothetical protein
MASNSKLTVPSHNSGSKKDPRKDASSRKEIIHF